MQLFIRDKNPDGSWFDVEEPVEVGPEFEALTIPENLTKRVSRGQVGVVQRAVERDGSIEKVLDSIGMEPGANIFRVVRAIVRKGEQAGLETMSKQDFSLEQANYARHLRQRAIQTLGEVDPFVEVYVRRATQPTATAADMSLAITALKDLLRENNIPEYGTVAATPAVTQSTQSTSPANDAGTEEDDSDEPW